MERFLDALAVLLPLIYLVVTVDYGFLFFTGRSLSEHSGRWGLRALVLVHLVYLVVLTLLWDQFPAASVSQALSLVAFSIAVVYAFVEWHGGERSTGFWMIALAFVFTLLSALLRGPEPETNELFQNPLFAAHVSLALLGYAAFTVSAGYGFLFLRLYRELKAGRFSIFYGKLPSLEVLERMMSGALFVGFLALTASLILGAVWAEQVIHGPWLSDPKILVSVVTWLLYAAALALRRFRRWRGREVAIASLAGFATVLFSFLAVNLWLSGFHSFH